MLRDTLETVSDEEDSPQTLFGENTADDEDESNEDLEKFNAYMAELLGVALDDTGRSSARSRRRSNARRAAEHAEPEAKASEREEEQTEAMEPVEETETLPEAKPSAYREEQGGLADEAHPQPDVRAELPGEIFEDYGDENEQEEAVWTAADPEQADEPAPFEVVEQLTILDTLPTPEAVGAEQTAQPMPQSDTSEDMADAADGSDLAMPEITADAAMDAADETVSEHMIEAEEETEDDSEAESEAETEDGAALGAETAPSGVEDDSPDMIDVSQADGEESGAQEDSDESAPLVLEKGDLLLDAEDELPPEPPKPSEPTPAKAEQTPAVPEATPEETSGSLASAPTPPAEEPPRPKQSPLDALTAQRQGNVRPVGNGASPFAARASKERTLTDDDVELLLDLGYDNHLTQKVGAQRIETVRYRRQDDEKARRKLRNVYGCAGEEYVSHTQDKSIRATYRAQQGLATLRLALGVILTVLAALSDLFPLLRDSLPPEATAFVPTSGAYGAIGLALLLLAAIVTFPYLKRGALALLRFAPIPASLPALLLFVSLAYQTVGLFDEQVGPLLTFPTVLPLLLLSVGERMNVRRESMTFDVVSARSRKIVMVALPPRKKKVVRGGHIVKIIDDDAGRRVWRVRPTDQVAGYFHRSARSTPRYRTLSVLLTLALAAALAVSVLTLIVIGELRAAMTAFLLTLQTSLPAAALVSYAYPALLASRKLAQQGCAIVGQSAVDEYAGDKTLLFDDTEMFRSKSSTEITIKGSGDTKKYIRYAKRLFRTLGGTLRGVSTSDLSEETWEERVEILKIYEQGVEARIDGKVHIFAGTSAFMVSQGIRVPGESAELLVRRNVESCILYLAFDGKLRLGYEVDYRISGRFEQTVAELAEAGTAVAIETCDPNLHEDFLTRSRRVGSIPVSVVKPVRFEKQTDSLLCDSGIVATRSARDAARATFMCDSLMENDARLSRFHRVATAFGAVVALALSLFGLADMTAGFIAALLQALWCLPVAVLSQRSLNNEEHSENEHANRKE